MERTPLRVNFYFLTQVTINVEHAVIWCKVDPIMGKKNTFALRNSAIVPKDTDFLINYKSYF